jgi:hypothetical protein
LISRGRPGRMGIERTSGVDTISRTFITGKAQGARQ